MCNSQMPAAKSEQTKAKGQKPATSAERIIMGIDPGSTVTGYGFIRCVGNKMDLMNYGVIELGKIKDDHPGRLRKIFERTLSLIEEFKPDELAIEAPFYGKNVQSMLKLGRAQGVAMAAALYRDIPIFEYAPKKVKMAVTGNGNASKEMVNAMLEKLLKFKFDMKMQLDASDGISLAVCHFFQRKISDKATVESPNRKKIPAGKKTFGSWKNYLAVNPERVKKKS